MLFKSWVFLFAFLPVALAGYFLIGRHSPPAAGVWLGLTSLFFYGWWSITALPLLFGSICLNYWVGMRLSVQAEHSRLGRTATPRVALTWAVLLNLALLGFFKYVNFFIDNANAALGALGVQPWTALSVILPIGISFYTFTQIAFLVDCWQGKVRERSFAHYLLFVTYFPHLIAGPVLHHAQMMPQFRSLKTYRPDFDQIALGIAIFVMGLCKKLLIADPLGTYADAFFAGVLAGQPANFAIARVGVLAYTLQIYFDFSGYSDMAIGLSLLFGISLPVNFRSPYQATSMIEFWRRWHISLSNFLRNYLYIPIGGNRHGPWRRHLNLLVTMLLGGLWHGASWTFVLWGAAHGILLIVNHLWRCAIRSSASQSSVFMRSVSNSALASRSCSLLGWALTFICIVFTWVLFRAENLSTAGTIFQAMLGLNGFDGDKWAWISLPISASEFWRTLLLAMLIAFLARPLRQYFERRLVKRSSDVPATFHGSAATMPEHLMRPMFAGKLMPMQLVVVVGLFIWCLSRLGQYSPFLYFQF